MSGKKITTSLSPLEARKQLLLVESELNRAQLISELHGFKNELHQLKNQVEAIGSIASAAVKVTSTFSGIWNAFSHRGENGENSTGKSWFSSLVNGAQLCASLLGAFRSKSK
jgi:hypothetical protein